MKQGLYDCYCYIAEILDVRIIFFTKTVNLWSDLRTRNLIAAQCGDHNGSNARELALMPLSRKVKVDVNRVVIHSYRVSIAVYSRAQSYLTWLRPVISVCTNPKDKSWTQYSECSVFEWVRGSGRCLPKHCMCTVHVCVSSCCTRKSETMTSFIQNKKNNVKLFLSVAKGKCTVSQLNRALQKNKV